MDVEADNQRHKREERARQQKRRERRQNKSEGQREKEARRREINQRVIADHNRKKPKSPKPPPPKDNNGGDSKFQALFTKRAEGFVIDLNFRNAAPRPPVGPCFVGLGLDGELNDKWTRYKPNNAVELSYAWKLHAEPDLGVPLAPSAMDLEGCYVDPTKANKKQKIDAYDELFNDDEVDEKKENKGPTPLHPEDEALINWKGYAGDSAAEELQNRRDKARAEARLQGLNSGKSKMSSGHQKQISLAKRSKGFQSRVLDEENPTFYKRTTYLANDPTQSVHAFKSLAQTKAQAAAEIEQKLEANKLSDVDAIKKSFDVANKSGVKRVHPTKRKVEAVYEIPLLPDDLTWGHTFTHVVLDKLPTMETKSELTAAKLEKAYISDVSRGTKNLRMECNLLVADDKGSDYNAIQKYDLVVFPLKEENAPHVNFLFMVDEEKRVASYHPISSRVQLSTGRPAHQNTATRSITKRGMDADEIIAMEKGLAEIDADMAEKHGIVEDDDNDDDVPVTRRENPFAAEDDSSDSDGEAF